MLVCVFAMPVAVRKLPTRLGETGKLRRGSKSKAQVAASVIPSTCVESDVGGWETRFRRPMGR